MRPEPWDCCASWRPPAPSWDGGGRSGAGRSIPACSPRAAWALRGQASPGWARPRWRSRPFPWRWPWPPARRRRAAPAPRRPPAAGGSGAAAVAGRAARDGQGVGLAWLAAGILGRAEGEVWAPAALEQGCALDPLSPFPPFYLMASAPDAAAAPRLGARALLAEPRLMAATFWEGREPLLRQALEEVRRWPGVDAGWKLALLTAAPSPSSRRRAIVRLQLIVDGGAFTPPTSLHPLPPLPS